MGMLFFMHADSHPAYSVLGHGITDSISTTFIHIQNLYIAEKQKKKNLHTSSKACQYFVEGRRIHYWLTDYVAMANELCCDG